MAQDHESITHGKPGAGKKKRRVLIILIIICAAVFAVSAYMLIQYYWAAHQAESSFAALRLPDDDGGDGSARSGSLSKYDIRQTHYRELYERNNDFVGWLRIFGTNVDYPVVQTPNERDYYLHRDFDKKPSAPGTLFASNISDIDKPSDVIIIFGHMMKSGAMFGGLKEYTSLDYMKDHQEIRFDTLAEERYYMIFSVFTEAVNTGKASEFKYYSASDFEDAQDFDDFMAQAKSKELYDTGETAVYGDEILALSTCEYTHADGRLVILAKRFTP
ncbi:MAG: class B sortase [Clostridiales Family XIII bacterium]|jgi:sortase B|nr:class B sortase [Clostridiales Family XIII bacterium]